jgi:predicted RNase H-like nuclease (RuvC/YqgF family)
MSEELVKQLQKEILRLKRREKILSNRVKRLYEDNENLATEIENLEEEYSAKFKKGAKRAPKEGCRKCGSEIDLLDMQHQTVIVCRSKTCNFRKVIKK